MDLSTAYGIYKNRSNIKRFIKWSLVIFAVFAFFVYLVFATVITVIGGQLRPPKPATIPASGQTQVPSASKH